MNLPFCSIIIVNYNGKRYLEKLLPSLDLMAYDNNKYEIIVADNGSTDGSVEYLKTLTDIVLINNANNNFASALNIAISIAKGDLIAFLNNDMEVNSKWLIELVSVIATDSKIGCVGSKILFKDKKTINSVGHKFLTGYFVEDKGYKENDDGQYDIVSEVESVSGGAVLWRKECLKDIGLVDEDYIMYFEDVDLCHKAKQIGWKIYFTFKSVVYHEFHGTSSNDLCEYMCDRNRLLFAATYMPDAITNIILSSHMAIGGKRCQLKSIIPILIHKIVSVYQKYNEKTLDRLLDELIRLLSPRDVQQAITAYDVSYAHKRPTMCIYDHALHFVGGGQKYVLVMASLLKEKYDITYIASKDIDIDTLSRWYNLNLDGITLKVIKLKYYEDNNIQIIDPNLASRLDSNPFDVISEESAQYDIFVNANMAAQVKPLSSYAIFICHFPDSYVTKYFHVHEYDIVIGNSRYTIEWTKKLWGIEIDMLLYPPIAMSYGQSEQLKENLIISVARFEVGGSKKQIELINAFVNLCNSFPQIKSAWKLVLAGGSIDSNPYLSRVNNLINKYKDYPIEVLPNLDLTDLTRLYARAKIFWHACGLDETRPNLIEHFGMTTVEAMQNKCVPIVINGGGQKEIVDHDVNGYLFNNINELVKFTSKVALDEELRAKLSLSALTKSCDYDIASFTNQVNELHQLITGCISDKTGTLEGIKRILHKA